MAKFASRSLVTRPLRGPQLRNVKTYLQANSSSDLFADIEQILDAEYHRNALSQPDLQNVDYQVLVATWTLDTGVSLYSSARTALVKVRDFQCLGAGAQMAT